MSTLKFSRKSWHYWLASNLGMDYSDSFAMRRKTRNICTYARAVFLNLLFLLFIITLSTGLLISLLVLPIYALISGNHSQNIMIPIIGVWGGVGIVAVAGLCGYLIHKTTRDWLPTYRRSHLDKKPSFIKTWFRSVKDKVCFLVEFED